MASSFRGIIGPWVFHAGIILIPERYVYVEASVLRISKDETWITFISIDIMFSPTALCLIQPRTICTAR